jgi:hypothetical protein
MCLTDLTCYYYSIFIIIAVLALPRRPIGPMVLAVGAASVILLGRDIGYARLGWGGFFYVDDNFVAQSYLFAILCILMCWAYSRPFSMERLKAWWDGKPEPKSGEGPTPDHNERALPAE